MSSKKDLTEELNEKETKVKKRLWTLVVYPESMREGWVDFLKFRGSLVDHRTVKFGSGAGPKLASV